VIRPNDLITVQVYTNEGERLIDPDLKLIRESTTQNAMNQKPNPSYLVNHDGVVKLPMVGELKLQGLTLRESEGLLQQEYSKFYQSPFVSLQYQNKRVIVLGSPGGQVIPLQNENTRLVEVLAMATGISNDGNAGNIRILRGDEVIVADLSSFDGYRKNNVVMEPGDIVYVEPIRRPVAESIRDYAPLVTILASLTTLIVVIIGL
jgi:polysaccharide biosynthesis/export protein